MNRSNEELILKKIVFILPLLITLGGLVAAHFNGIAFAINESKNYTNERTNKLEMKLDELLRKQENANVDIAVIKQVLLNDVKRKTKIISASNIKAD